MSDREVKQNKGISRREFLKTAATVSAAGMLGSVAPVGSMAELADTGMPEKIKYGEQTQYLVHQKDEAWRQKLGKVKIEKLLEPGYIGKVKTRNRMIKTAAYGWILWDMQKGQFRPEGLGYYEAIAKGGVGLMIMEDPAFRPDTIGRPLYEDKSIEAERQLVNLIHSHGCPTFAQFTDFRPLMGIAASSEVYYPSKLDMNNSMPRALSTEEIHENTRLIADCAERCQKAGYDGVEINTACSHLFATFTSRFWNRREDEYGPQSFENRGRIVTDMIQAIKDRCGQDFAVGILLNGFEIDVLELGNSTLTCTTEEAIELTKLYEQAGADSIQVRSHAIGNHLFGFFPNQYYMFGETDTGFGQPIDIKKHWPDFITEYDGAGAFIDMAARFKKALSIPVFTVGAMDPRLIPDVAENAIRDGKIDFVAMTRPLTADPELPNKFAEGRIEDVRPCTYCLTCFPMSRCRVNATSTRIHGPEMPEGLAVQPAITKKKVLVIGGGPGGLEAARVAAERGHEVTLYEKTGRLGGLMPVAALVKGRHEKILDFVNYLTGQIKKLGVTVKLGKEVTPAVVEELQPDAVIVATGGKMATLNIPGIDNRKVISSSDLHSQLELGLKIISPFALRSLTNFYMPVGKKVVIIGGQIQGLQLAEFLAQRDRDVTIVDEAPEDMLGFNLPNETKSRVILYNQAHGVKTLMGVKYGEITDAGMTVTTSYGITKTIEADSIILALPVIEDTSLADSLKGIVSEVYSVGDCSKSGVIVDAVEAANLTARRI